MRWLVLLLALCKSASAAPPSRLGSVTGRVTEYGERVAEFAVVVSGMPNASTTPHVTETPDGTFTVYGVPPGKHAVTIIGWAFVDTWILDVEVVAGKTADLGTIVTEPGIHAEGTVSDDAGVPVKGATVMVFRDHAPALAPAIALMAKDVRSATTDAGGHYVIDGIAGDHLQIVAVAPPNVNTETGVLTSGATTLDPNLSMVDLVVRETGGLTGTLVGSVRPITATFVDDENLAITVTPDARGAFAFTDLPIGAWDLKVDDKLAPLRAQVAAGQVTIAKYVMPKLRASVTLVGACSTLTILGARQLEKEIGTPLASESCEEDRTTVRGLAPGRYRVCVDEDGECSEYTLKAGAQTLRLPPPSNHEEPPDL